jgi:HEXXH motif-containing protein
MTRVVDELLAGGAEMLSAVKSVLLLKALDGVSDGMSAIARLPATVLAEEASPFVWLNVQRAHGTSTDTLDAGASEELPTEAPPSLPALCLDALFAHLPVGFEAAVEGDSPLPVLSLRAPRGAARLKKASAEEIEVESVDGTRSRVRLQGPERGLGLPTWPVSGTSAVVAALRDPSLFEATYIDQLAGTDDVARELAAQLVAAVRLVELAHPEAWKRLQARTRWFIPLHPNEPNVHTSFTAPNLPRVMFLSPATTSDQLAEAVVHELGHDELNVVFRAMPLIRDHGVLVYSPWRPDVRPLHGLVHALHVFSEVAQYLRGRLDSEPTSRSLLNNLHLVRSRVAIGLQQIPNGSLTPVGEAVVADAARTVDRCAAGIGAAAPHVARILEEHRARWLARNSDHANALVTWRAA